MRHVRASAANPGISGPAYPRREYWDRRPVSIDFYNNYITDADDNSIEMDGSMHNIRLIRNVLINSPSHPMSTQPSGGGPIYWIRNIVYVYHATRRIDADDGGIAGRALLPQHGHHRDERGVVGQLALAQQADARPGHRAGDLLGDDRHQLQLVRLQRLPAEPRTAGGARRRPASTPLEEYSKATGQDRNSVLVDYHVFVNVPKLDRDPKTVQRLYDFRDYDFRLRPGAAAIDRGVAIPNVNDGFSGKAPDLGALEAGPPPPHHDPRPAGRD